MLALILKLGDVETIIEIRGDEINSFIEALRNSVILDREGDTWIIDPAEETYFDSYPPHFEISCKKRD